jgi:hypothetical protein
MNTRCETLTVKNVLMPRIIRANIQAATEEHQRALAAVEAAADASIHALEAQMVVAAHGAAVAERAAEQEAAALRAGVSAAQGE